MRRVTQARPLQCRLSGGAVGVELGIELNECVG